MFWRQRQNLSLGIFTTASGTGANDKNKPTGAMIGVMQFDCNGDSSDDSDLLYPQGQVLVLEIHML